MKAPRVPSPHPSFHPLSRQCCSDNLLIYFGGGEKKVKTCCIISLAAGEEGRKSKEKQFQCVDFLSLHLSIIHHATLLSSHSGDRLTFPHLSTLLSYTNCPCPSEASVLSSALLHSLYFLTCVFLSFVNSLHVLSPSRLLPLLSLFFLALCHYRDIIYEVLKMFLSELLCSVTKVTNT